MEFVPFAAMALLLYQLINFLRALSGRDINTAVTLAVAWVAGVITVLLVAQTDFASGIPVGDQTLASLNVASLVFVGLVLSSSASSFNDAVGAVDHNRTTAKPHLWDPPPPPA